MMTVYFICCILAVLGFLVDVSVTSSDLNTCDGLVDKEFCYWVTSNKESYDKHICNKTPFDDSLNYYNILDELRNRGEVYIYENYKRKQGKRKRRKKRSSEERECTYLNMNNVENRPLMGSCDRKRYALCYSEHYDSWGEWEEWSSCSLDTEKHKRKRSCLGYRCNDLKRGEMYDKTEYHTEECNPYDEWDEWSQWGDCELLTESHNRSRHCMGEICRVENSKKGAVEEIQNKSCNPYGNWTEWTRWGVCPVTEVRKRWRFCVGSKYCREEDGIGRMMNETCIPEREGVLLALPGRLLDHSSLVIEGVDSLVSCAVHCKSHSSYCTSVNYEPNELLCELNDKEGKLHPSDLEETNDMKWVNFEFMVVEEEEEPININN